MVKWIREKLEAGHDDLIYLHSFSVTDWNLAAVAQLELLITSRLSDHKRKPFLKKTLMKIQHDWVWPAGIPATLQGTATGLLLQKLLLM